MDKNEILRALNPAQIYTRFLNLTEIPRGNISSPFAEDKNPSFKIYKNGTFKCFSSGRQGDVFQFVADLKNLDCKRDFKKVLELIAVEFNLSTTGDSPSASASGDARSGDPNPDPGADGSDPDGDPIENHFVVTTQNFSQNHFNYWFKLLNRTDLLMFLENYNVKPLKHLEYYSQKKSAIQKYTVYKGVLSFAYKLNGRYEIYTPEQPEKKIKKFFYSGLLNSDIFGLKQLKGDVKTNKVNTLIICAGKKDCLCLNARNFPSVAFRSEAIFPTAEQIQTLREKSEKLYICYDNDFDNPNNPGRTQMLKIAEKYAITPIFLPDTINDIADYFLSGKTISDFADLIKKAEQEQSNKQEVEDSTKNTIFHTAEKYLSANYDLRFNTVKLDVEVSKKSISNWQSLNENNLYIELQKKGINISIEKLLSILKSDYVTRYNPFTSYFQSLPEYNPAKEPDHIQVLSSYINAYEQEGFTYHFRKWLVRTVKCAILPDYFNKQAFILVQSEQNSGKSTFCRFLCPPTLSDYIAEDISNDKDARILLCKNFLINLDELAVLSKQEINSLKSYFSKTQINERLPYDRKNSIIPRTCSFVGSTNMDEFLNDETGSVRWLCFRIHSINWAYKQLDINRLWAQAYHLAKDKNFESELTQQDIITNEERNHEFTILSKEKALIYKYFVPNDLGDELQYLTATDVEIYLRNKVGDMRLSIVAIGKAIKALGYPRIKHEGIYCYIMKPKEEEKNF
ncbi:MAG: hypothetical protein LBE12_14575 [Planctomycetaceae bacterium]|jgi:predicted P-loop ATPase|nr:hypothetical protein [Planctomycetaceae bacterium]